MVFPKSQLFPRIPLPDLSLYLSQGSSHSRIRVNTGRMNTNTVDCIIFFSLENKPSCVGSVNFLKVFNIYYPSFSPMVSFLLPKILFHCFCLKVRNPPNSFASCSKITADGAHVCKHTHALAPIYINLGNNSLALYSIFFQRPQRAFTNTPLGPVRSDI